MADARSAGKSAFAPAARFVLRAAVALGAMATLGAVAHLPLGAAPAASALRVALRTQHARVELCHEPTEAELAGLPAHMRQKRICTETAIDYRLRVEVDGETRIDRVISHRGVRHNRPLVVDALIAVRPGRRAVTIEFAPIRPEGFEGAFESVAGYRLDDAVEAPLGRVRVAALGAQGLFWLPVSPAPAVAVPVGKS
jgi:hypothetical protein